MNLNFNAYLAEQYDGGMLPPAEETKARVLRLPVAKNGIPKGRLREDRNQCPTCQEFFKSSKAFDQHRVGVIGINRRCLTTAEMQARNFGRTTDAFWCSPVAQKDRERLNQIRARGKDKRKAKETEAS
jgi:hypothetical protein